MTRFHLNPEKGPMRCTAADGQCPYGDTAPHFATKEEAITVYENLMNADHPFPTLNKKASDGIDEELKKLDKDLEKAPYDDIFKYADESEESHGKLNSLINARCDSTLMRFNQLEELNPKNENASNPITQKNFKVLRREYQSYRDQTAIMVEAHSNSQHYEPKSIHHPSTEPLGTAVPATQYAEDDPNWYLSRYNTIGGSDVGALVIQDFRAGEDQTGFDKFYIKKIEAQKTAPPTDEDAANSFYLGTESRGGPLYRGTVWEDRIRDQYADDHPALTVYHTSGQYNKEGNEWHRINVDGVVSDRPDGKPNGILEIKTGGVPEVWADGVPLKYRAQTLYYLNATGYSYADVRVLLNDGESRDYRLHASDPVAPGSDVVMEDYVKDRVSPWFDELKSQRTA